MLPLMLVLACRGGVGDSESDPSKLPIAVVVAPVGTAVVPITTPLAGTIRAFQEAQVAADTSGVVVDIQVQRGDRVAKGDALVGIDSRMSALSAVASQAQAAAQEAQLAAAVADCGRTEELAAAGLVARAQVDRASAGCDAARSGLKAAKASAQLADTALAKARVRAPFAGVVGERLVELGSFVAAQQPVVTLYGDGPLRVEFSVPERLATSVAVGQVLTVSGDNSLLVAGEISSLSGALRAQTHDRIGEAILGEAIGFMPGMFVQVDLQVGSESGLVVPRSAVRTTGTTHRVFVSRDKVAVETLVRLGPVVGDHVAVASGLTVGDLLVVQPPDGLADGRALE